MFVGFVFYFKQSYTDCVSIFENVKMLLSL